MKSCLDLQALLISLSIGIRFSFLFNESLITRARNLLVDQFLSSNCSHLLFVDSDIQFEARDVVTMLTLDKDVIGAPYAKKSINWENVKKAVVHNPQIPGEELEQLVGHYLFHLSDQTRHFDVREPLEVLAIGCGFMLIKRQVFATFAQAYPHLRYRSDSLGAGLEEGRRIHAYFDTEIDPESQKYLSEDFRFCRYWRKIGGTVWLCPWVRTRHWGSYGFHGNLLALSQTLPHPS